MKTTTIIAVIGIILSSLLLSCKKFVEVSPPKTDLTSVTVFASDITAKSAIAGIYAELGEFGFASGGGGSVTSIGELSADHLDVYTTTLDYQEIAANNIIPRNSQYSTLWSTPYTTIFRANSMLEALSLSSGVSTNLKSQLIGEAKFLRAFAHFYLVNMFGDVPLVLTSDYRSNRTIGRTPKAKVYQQIISDLIDAQDQMVADYSFSNNERVRPNKFAATALLARVYLYDGDWINAETEATKIIGATSLYSLPALNSVFLKNSTETIWSLASDQMNTNDASLYYISPTANGPFFAALKSSFVSLFIANDQRRTEWIGTHTTSGKFFPLKYKATASTPITEYSIVLRLAEQYLIRAEARAHQNKLTGANGAESDLNAIRARAGLLGSLATTQSGMLTAIALERQLELFTEWGHRWFDLKRTGKVDEVIGSLKSTYQPTDALYPIPQNQILNDPAMADAQNPGY